MFILWCLSSVLNLVQISVIVISHRDRRPFVPDIHLMTSRELTSDFDFWLCGHLRMAVKHPAIIFGTGIFLQSGLIDIFPKLMMAAAVILDLLGEPWGHLRTKAVKISS